MLNLYLPFGTKGRWKYFLKDLVKLRASLLPEIFLHLGEKILHLWLTQPEMWPLHVLRHSTMSKWMRMDQRSVVDVHYGVLINKCLFLWYLLCTCNFQVNVKVSLANPHKRSKQKKHVSSSTRKEHSRDETKSSHRKWWFVLLVRSYFY